MKREPVDTAAANTSRWSDILGTARFRYITSVAVAASIILLAANEMDGWLGCLAAAGLVIQVSHSMPIKKTSTRALVKMTAILFVRA